MEVIVYTTPTCPYCSQAKAFLAQQGVPFVEKDVAADRRAAMEMVRVSGQQGVPVITVNGEPVVGFDQPRLRQLLKKAKPRLGASVADAASFARKQPDIPVSGAYVGKVRSGSPADKAGLHKGDVITALGGQPIILVDDLYNLAAQVPQGRDISLTYVRDGRAHDTLIRL
jgi:glutaredoxin-like YruB-family protein